MLMYCPDGVPMIYDRDFADVPAAKVAPGGVAAMIELIGQRVELEPFEIIARPKVPYRELFNRRFRALDRAKDKLIWGMELREDLIGFSLLATAWAAGPWYTLLGTHSSDTMNKQLDEVGERLTRDNTEPSLFVEEGVEIRDHISDYMIERLGTLRSI